MPKKLEFKLGKGRLKTKRRLKKFVQNLKCTRLTSPSIGPHNVPVSVCPDSSPAHSFWLLLEAHCQSLESFNLFQVTHRDRLSQEVIHSGFDGFCLVGILCVGSATANEDSYL